MYFPYFRGKQYELITIRECAEIFSGHDMVPIIEPVKESLNALKKTLEVLDEKSAKAVLIINPTKGHFIPSRNPDWDGLGELISSHNSAHPGFILTHGTNAQEIIDFLQGLDANKEVTFIHRSFDDADLLLGLCEQYLSGRFIRHAFLDDSTERRLYRRKFRNCERIVIQDGFKKKKNSEYDPKEYFSDLHVTYKEMGMNGFGDFLIVGDEYSEAGGPAYAIAIHLTEIEDSEEMFVRHFLSIRQNTPKDPAGKFIEALDAMIDDIDAGQTFIEETEAVKEFRELHERRHFPGLGYVKKLSMNHHIQTIANFLS